ncbi:HU family DNA-binding protein [Methylorubrum extorquens]|nr:HU family DNA-binding protein [Methylorubrum extorquens]MCP1546595.1 nucleoid DNA-binding protein [Methylorubrum extorquens]MCP1591262.1 nucleoid DNA-binding protein [Methylorubrum extorquens]
MTLAELESVLAGRLGLGSEETSRVVRAALSLVAERLAAGEDVKLQGFGRFCVRDRPARRRKDPRDGRELEVPARRGAVFRPSRLLREALNRSSEDR